MPPPEPVTIPLRHYAPVWLRNRAGLPERLALDPLDVPVSVRGVDPDALSPRPVPMSAVNRVEAYEFEGRLWRPVYRTIGEGQKVQGLADGLAVLSGEDGPAAGPLAPYLPEFHANRMHAGAKPIPPRALARASLGLHAIATARARDFAARDLVHDGGRFLAAMDLPLLAMPKGGVCLHRWRVDGKRWRPLFPHDRPDLAVAHFASKGYARDHVEENRASKEGVVRALGEALEGIPSGADNLRHMVNTAPFFLLEAAEMFEGLLQRPVAEEDLAGLRELAALGAIDAAPRDYGRFIPLFRRACVALCSGGGTSREENGLRDLARDLDRYCLSVALPQLADGPVPEADLDGLASLAP